jgi:hypothetical protein
MGGVMVRASVAAAAALALIAIPAGSVSAAAGPAVLAFQPAPYDYGQVSMGERPERAFTLVNTGGRASGALTFRVSGSAAFTITADTCPPSLGPGKACTVSVQFAPTTPGAAAATLTAANKRQTVTTTDALSGTGRRAAPGDFGDAGSAACSAIPGFVDRDFRLEPTSSWGCVYTPGANPPGDAYSTSLQVACSTDTNKTGKFSTSQFDGDQWLAICVNQ